VTASLSFIITKIEDVKKQKDIILKIKNKFSQLPNTNYLNVWLQRLTLKIDNSIQYNGKLCEKVIDKNVAIWNSEWLNVKFKKIVEETEIIIEEKTEKIEITFSEAETEQLVEYDFLYS